MSDCSLIQVETSFSPAFASQTMSMSSSHTKHHLEDMHENIAVMRHPDHVRPFSLLLLRVAANSGSLNSSEERSRFTGVITRRSSSSTTRSLALVDSTCTSRAAWRFRSTGADEWSTAASDDGIRTPSLFRVTLALLPACGNLADVSIADVHPTDFSRT